MIKVRFGTLIAKDVLEMVGSKWAAIFPLRITSAITFANGNPAMPAHRLSLPRIGLLEPRYHKRRFRLELAMRNIVVRERTIKGVLPRNKGDWNVIPPRTGVWVIVSPVIRRPIEVSTASVVGDRIIASGLFSDPKYRGNNVRLPRVALDRRSRTGRDEHLWFHLEQRLLPQFHCVPGEICRSRVRRSRLFIPEDFRDASNCQT